MQINITWRIEGGKTMNLSEDDKLLRIGEAAKIIGVSKQTLRNWEREGDISPEYTKGGHRRYPLSLVKDFQLSETVNDEKDKEEEDSTSSNPAVNLTSKDFDDERIKPIKSEMKMLDLLVREYQEDQGIIILLLGLLLKLTIKLMHLAEAPKALIDSANQTSQLYLDFSVEFMKTQEDENSDVDDTIEETRDKDVSLQEKQGKQENKTNTDDSLNKESTDRSQKQTIWSKTKNNAPEIMFHLNRASVNKDLPKRERERANKIISEILGPYTRLTNLLKEYPEGTHQHDVAYLLLFKKPDDYDINRKGWSIRLLSWVCINILDTEAASKSQVGRLLKSINWNCAIKPKMISPDPNYGQKLKKIGLLFCNLKPGDKVLYGDEFLYSTVKVAEYQKEKYAPKGANSILPWSQSKKYYRSDASVLVNGLVDITTNQLEVDELGTKSYKTYKKSLDRLLTKIYDNETSQGTIYILLDNARYHSPRRLNRRLRKKYDEKIIPIFLPTYSPNQNPIERIWQYLLRNSLRCGETEEELWFELSEAVKSYTSQEGTKDLSLHCEICGHKWEFTDESRVNNAKSIEDHLCFNIKGLSPYSIYVLKHSVEHLQPKFEANSSPIIPIGE